MTRLAGWIKSASLAAVSLVCACTLPLCGGCSRGNASETVERPDLVEISIAGAGAKPARPPVVFPHDMHTEALEPEGADCKTCHKLRKDGYLSQLYMRLDEVGAAGPAAAAADSGDSALDRPAVSEGGSASGSVEEVPSAPPASGDPRTGAAARPWGGLMDLYHENCIACHEKRASEGVKAGPVSCGECHRAKPAYVSSRRPFGMNMSLHQRHSIARADKCEDCHHIYEEKAKKVIYEKGQENPCRDCHRGETEGIRSSMESAAHRACIKCHMETAEQGPEVKTGPRACAGCHDLQKQLAIKVLEKIPRLKRNQPDFVLLSAPKNDLESTKFRTVPFSHVEHEGATETCRDCHHESMKACNECHTLRGSEDGGGVMLRAAMHSMASGHSCVGCHERSKAQAECAGCHGLMEKGRLSDHACDICHVGPSPEKLEAERSRYASLDDFRGRVSGGRPKFAAGEIPDSVVVSVLSKEYEPAVMPHRKIVEKLREHIKDSKVATYFHGNENVVCQGCHHHGSLGEKPALCENCHGRPFDESDPYKPGLYGAYHRQCLGCHREMGLKEPSDCTGCHKKKEQAAG